MNWLTEQYVALSVLSALLGGIAGWAGHWLFCHFRRTQAQKQSESAHHARQHELDTAKSELRQLRFIENITEGYFFYRHDTEGHFTYLSPSVNRVLGYNAEEYHAHYEAMFTENPVNETAREMTRLTLQGQRQPTYPVEVRAKDGTIRQLEVTEYPVCNTDGQVEAVEGIAHDVTERNHLEVRLAELAVRDELTGLANRRHLLERLQEAVSLAQRHGYVLSFALVDLDGLKEINDNHGHAAGDKMICAMVEILQRELRRGDIVGRANSFAGRLGGDEFAVIMPYCTAHQADTAFKRILETLCNTTVHLDDGTKAVLSASIGIAEYKPDMSIEALEERADQAMYDAKRAGRGRVCMRP